MGELMDDSDEDPPFDPRKEGGKMWDVESSDSGEDDEDIRAAIAESRALMAMQVPGARRDGAGPSSAPDPQDSDDGDVDGGVSETAKQDTDDTDGDEEQDPGDPVTSRDRGQPAMWRPTETWARSDRLWCTKSGTLQAKGRIHIKTCANCPLNNHKQKELVTYVEAGADELRQCSCGAMLEAGKMGIRNVINRHLRLAKKSHPTLATDPEARRQEVIRLLNTKYRTVTFSRSEACKGEFPLYTEHLTEQEEPEPGDIPDTSEDAATLMTSIRVLGIQSVHWMTETILGEHINAVTRANYIGTIRSLLVAADLESAKDWRYIIANSRKLIRLRDALNKRMSKHPSHGDLTAAALKRLMKELRGSLLNPEMHDGKRREWRQITEEVGDIIDRAKAINQEAKIKRNLESEAKKQASAMASTEQRKAVREVVVRWMSDVMEHPPEDDAQRRKTALIFRQAVYILLSLFSGHRTGVILGLTCKALKHRDVHSQHGVVSVLFTGGKTRKTSGSTTVVIPSADIGYVMFYMTHLRPFVPVDHDDDRLLAGFHPYTLVYPELNPEQLDMSSIMQGNLNRSYHLLQTETLKGSDVIDKQTAEHLTDYRRHSACTAKRSYDRFRKVKKDIRVQAMFLKATGIIQDNPDMTIHDLWPRTAPRMDGSRDARGTQEPRQIDPPPTVRY